ncbi:MAG TPA: hypothetical protein VF525_15375 [Pyrinomonadaceae bacterium]|jgi:hypothetical protein
MNKEDNRSAEFARGDQRSDEKSVKGVLRFWLLLIGVLVVGLLVCALIFGWSQGR